MPKLKCKNLKLLLNWSETVAGQKLRDNVLHFDKLCPVTNETGQVSILSRRGRIKLNTVERLVATTSPQQTSPQRPVFQNAKSFQVNSLYNLFRTSSKLPPLVNDRDYFYS